MKHRIILLNFTRKDAQVIAKAGYNVECGFIGTAVGSTSFPYLTPHPLYEYDILFYNSNISPELENEIDKHPHNLLNETGSYEALKSFRTPPIVRISFIGEPRGANNLIHGGVSCIKLIHAEQNVSSFQTYKGSTFSINELHDLLAQFKNQVQSVKQFFVIPEEIYPFHHHAVLVSRSGEQVAGYGTTYSEKNTTPRYIILPELKNIPLAVVQILQCLENIFPQLFPDKIRRDWLKTDEFLMPEEKTIDTDIQKKISETTIFVDAMKKKKEEIAQKNSFVRGLLVATEDGKIDPETRLSGVVMTALEFLEFKVENIDEKTRSIIKKEDFWVIDGNYLAITEVSGTVNKNPKVKEFNDILARLATIYKRKGDLVLPEAVSVSGLLILNYDIDTHPSKRPKLYTGEDEHIVETAIEQGIGLLSTVELHKVIMAVIGGFLSKVEARKIVRRLGRIEYDAITQQGAQEGRGKKPPRPST
jgi:hypothetical protein